ncbi:hypothetical protein [Nostoc sp. CALU 546]|uniref:hypothetical protein n=1 Tax=Nostoc sp. CALU 546 TaxID=1867241 RepID=UPI003B66D09E
MFTARSPERIIKEGGSQSWILNPARAKLCTWLVCTQNRRNPDHEFSGATEPHGSGFLLGKISAVSKSQEEGDDNRNRWLIAISEFVLINVHEVWGGWRNPVRYTSLEKLGISIDGMEFQPIPQQSKAPLHSEQSAISKPTTMLTIAEAKKALATTFGVSPEAVEITIRG